MSEGLHPVVRPAGKRLMPVLLALAVLGGGGPVLADDGPGELRDPLQPPQPREPSTAPQIDKSRWQLSSTLVSAGRRVAIINGRVVAPGESVDGARVLGVTSNGARLRAGGQQFTIRSATPRVRKSAGEEAR